MSHLLRSHPDLSTINSKKLTEEDEIEELICEQEMEAYTTEDKELYEEATEKAKALREIYENNIIEKLFV